LNKDLESLLTKERTKTIRFDRDSDNLSNGNQFVMALERKANLKSVILERVPTEESFIDLENVNIDIKASLEPGEFATSFTTEYRSKS
jgi:hypothetical protein